MGRVRAPYGAKRCLLGGTSLKIIEEATDLLVMEHRTGAARLAFLVGALVFLAAAIALSVVAMVIAQPLFAVALLCLVAALGFGVVAVRMPRAIRVEIDSARRELRYQTVGSGKSLMTLSFDAVTSLEQDWIEDEGFHLDQLRLVHADGRLKLSAGHSTSAKDEIAAKLSLRLGVPVVQTGRVPVRQ